MCSGSEAGYSRLKEYLRLIDVVYHSTPGLREIEKKRRCSCFIEKAPLVALLGVGKYSSTGLQCNRNLYRGTSLIRNCPPLGPYSRPVPRALWWS